MRKVLLSLALLAFAGVSANAADRVSPESFVGTYKLVKAQYGLLCDEELHGYLSRSLNPHDDAYVQIDLGAFVFTAVNLGPQNYDDSLATTTTESFTTSDGRLEFHSREVSKVDGEVSTENTVAQLDGSRLTIVSKGTFAHPGGSHGETYFECLYKKVDDGK
jgi:hypothetical protein